MVGCSRFFKNKDESVKTLGVVRTPNNLVPGVRTKSLLEMVAFGWEKYVDYFQEVGTIESFEKSLSLIRRGLVVGPSSGFAFAGLLKYLGSLKDKNELDGLKNEAGLINSVFICCDSPFPYLDEYFKYLDESHFPSVENAHLLDGFEKVERVEIVDYEVSCDDAYEIIYGVDKEELWEMIRNNYEVKVKEGVLVVDVRDESDFEHFRLVGSENIEFEKLVSNIGEYSDKMSGKKVVVVCKLGVSSGSAVSKLRGVGVDAYSLRGGVTDWSNFNFPRWKPEFCFNK